MKIYSKRSCDIEWRLQRY